MKVHRYGDRGLYLDWELEPGDSTSAQLVRDAASALRSRFPEAELVLGAGSLAVIFPEGTPRGDDPAFTQSRIRHFEQRRAELLAALGTGLAPPVPAHEEPCGQREHRIAVVYDGPDLADVAYAAGLSVDEVVHLHGARAYEVELIGFLPGFAYLGPLDARLVVPRRPSPRPRVPAGSVGLAGRYTGIYPLASPGGWQLIGRATDLTLFDAHRSPPALLHPGDWVRFVSSHG